MAKNASQVGQPEREYTFGLRQDTTPEHEYEMLWRELENPISSVQRQQLTEPLQVGPPSTYSVECQSHPCLPQSQPLSAPYSEPTAVVVDSVDGFLYSNPDEFGSYVDSGLFPTCQLPCPYQFVWPWPYISPGPVRGTAIEFVEQLDDSSRMSTLPLDSLQSPFYRFGSRLPSLQPEEMQVGFVPTRERHPNSLAEVTIESRDLIVEKINQFSEVIPVGFTLSSRHGLSRFLAGYVTGFQEQFPFLHLATLTIENSSIELVLTLASVGARYCREPEESIELFSAAQAIAMERIRRRNYRVVDDFTGQASNVVRSNNGAIPLQNGVKLNAQSVFSDTSRAAVQNGDKMIETAQALLLLVAEATWLEHEPPVREALAIRSVLASLVHDEGLGKQALAPDNTWENWIRFEGAKRTKFMIFSFFNIHTVVFDMPPMVVSGEVHMDLPSTEAEWRAPTTAAWQDARRKT